MESFANNHTQIKSSISMFSASAIRASVLAELVRLPVSI